MRNNTDNFEIYQIDYHCDIKKSDKNALKAWEELKPNERLAKLNKGCCMKCMSMPPFASKYRLISMGAVNCIEGKCSLCGGEMCMSFNA